MEVKYHRRVIISVEFTDLPIQEELNSLEDVPYLFPRGTKFQEAVWHSLLLIPKGETRTYSQIAEEIGRPKSYRAVANACGKNPLAYIIPCHRVVAKNGIGGYSCGGVRVKRSLLALEGVNI